MTTLAINQPTKLDLRAAEKLTVRCAPGAYAVINPIEGLGVALDQPISVEGVKEYSWPNSGQVQIQAYGAPCDYSTSGGVGDSSNIRAANRVVLGILGQSLERGQVDPLEAIGGVLSRVAHPQAFASLRNPAVRYPAWPCLQRYGGFTFALYDTLYDAGHEPNIINGSIGSLSMIRDACGQIQTRANSTAYRQKRNPEGFGDMGYAGDVLVDSGRVFVCTKGVRAYAYHAGAQIDMAGATDLDYLRIVGSNLTAASPPAGLATAAVGDVVVDGTAPNDVQWTCVSTSTTWNGYSYGGGNCLLLNRYGFDPFGLCHRLQYEIGAVREAAHRIVLLQNGQSDTGNANLTYQNALENIGAFFLGAGIKVAIGLTCYTPTNNTTNYNNLTTRVNNALTTLRAAAGTTYALEDVITGANLYTLMGSTGPMATGGAYFAKDSGQDNIHMNAPGSIVGGGLMGQFILAGINQ